MRLRAFTMAPVVLYIRSSARLFISSFTRSVCSLSLAAELIVQKLRHSPNAGWAHVRPKGATDCTLVALSETLSTDSLTLYLFLYESMNRGTLAAVRLKPPITRAFDALSELLWLLVKPLTIPMTVPAPVAAMPRPRDVQPHAL